MSLITNLCYQLNSSFTSNEYSKKLDSITSQLEECEAYNEKWSEKLSDLEDKKRNGEYYSIFDMKKCQQQIKTCKRVEARLNKEKESAEKGMTISDTMAKGFESGASDYSSVFGFNL